MAVAITSSYNADDDSPGFDFSITGLGPFGFITVERLIDGIFDEYVRGFNNVTASSVMAGSDYEAPVNRNVSYKAIGSGGAPAEDDTSSEDIIPYTDPGQAWLKSVFIPQLSRQIDIVAWPTTDYPTNILSASKPLGRKNPVVITDAWGGREVTIEVVTDEDLFSMGWMDFKKLLVEGGTLLLQTADPAFTGEEDMFCEVTSYSRARRTKVDGTGMPLFVHSVTLREVDRPDTAEESLGLRSYDDVLAQNNTYDDVLAEYVDYIDLLVRDI